MRCSYLFPTQNRQKKNFFLYEGENLYTLREYPPINLAKQLKKSFSTNVVFRPLCAEISADTKQIPGISPACFHFPNIMIMRLKKYAIFFPEALYV